MCEGNGTWYAAVEHQAPAPADGGVTPSHSAAPVPSYHQDTGTTERLRLWMAAKVRLIPVQNGGYNKGIMVCPLTLSGLL